MKVLLGLIFTLQIVSVGFIRAQNVLQGDSIFQGLQPGKSSFSDLLYTLGKPNSITESRNFVHLRLQNGGDGHVMRLDGYKFNYHKLRVKVILNLEKTIIEGIQFGPKSSVITTYGIQPARSTFVDVVRNYGSIDPNPKPRSFPINAKRTKHKTYLRYQGITFISYGHWKTLEELLPKSVDEIVLN